MLAEDTLLITPVRYRDHSAIAELVRRHHRFLTAIATPLVGPHTAEVVIAESWIQAIRELNRFDGRTSLRLWVGRILFKEASRRHCARGPDGAYLQGGRDTGSPIAHRFGPEGRWRDPPEDWRRGRPDQMLSRDARGSSLSADLKRLPAEQQIVLHLLEFESLALEEVAALLERPMSDVRRLRYRAQQNLHASIDQFAKAAVC